MTPREQELMLQSELGRSQLRAAAEFARTFNPEGWTTSVLQRASPTHARGAPCFRKGKSVIYELPDGYAVTPTGRVTEERNVPSVTVSAKYHNDPAKAAPDTLSDYAGNAPTAYEKGDLIGQDERIKKYGTDPGYIGNLRPVREMTPRLRRLFAAAILEPFRPHLGKIHQEVLGALPNMADRSSLREDAPGTNDHFWKLASMHGLSGYSSRDHVGDAHALLMAVTGPAVRSDYHLHVGDVSSAMSLAARQITPAGPSGTSRPTDQEIIDNSHKVADTIRSLIGDPYHAHRLPASPEIRRLAKGVYASGDRAGLLALSDLMADAGADDYTLNSLRNPNAAVRGHWVLDAILGKPR